MNSILSFFSQSRGIVEAEDFIYEEKGGLTIKKGRIEASKNATILGWNIKGHAVEWEVNIPKTGLYKVVFRFANGRYWTTLRDFKIDGTYPSKEFKRIEIEPSGGFCKKENNWQNITVLNKNQEPVFIKIKR